MIKTISKLLFYLKIFLLLTAFSLVLYISFMKMDFMSSNVLAILPFFIPFLLLLILSVIGFAFNKGNSNLLYNLSCVLSFLAIIIISLRALIDKNIIQYGTSINYNFFTSQEVRIKLLLYLMIISNIGLLYYEKKQKDVKMHS